MAAKKTLSVDFYGDAKDWFGIWIANIFLTLVTLGIYSAWAKVRFKKYFYQHTYIGGRNFNYHGKPVNILIGRVIVVALISLSYVPLAQGWIFVLFLLGAPVALVMSARFNARNSSWSNVRFNFVGSIGRAYMVYLVYPGLLIVCLMGAAALLFWLVIGFDSPRLAIWALANGPMIPVVVGIVFCLYLAAVLIYVPVLQRLSQSYAANGHRFGDYQFYFDVGLGPYVVGLLTATMWGIVGLLLGGAAAFVLLLPFGGALNEASGIIVGYAAFGLGFVSYRVKVRNILLNNLVLAKGQVVHRFRSSAVVSEVLVIVVTNVLAVGCTLGLMLPWAMVRYYRYMAENTFVRVSGDLDDFVGQVTDYKNALGEAYGDFEGLDLGIGL